MKRILASTAVLALAAGTVSAQVWINEVLANPYGTDTGKEYFELRGTPNMSLAGYYLLSLEGQGAGRGDINQFFDLGAFSIGANGYLFARQADSPYTTTAPGAAVIQNTAGTGWGLTGASTAGHSGDGTQVDLENGATTMMLINIGSGSAPILTLNLDADSDGFLDALPAGWSVIDSVGLLDGSSPAASDTSYGAITFRAAYPAGTYLGSSPEFGNVFDVPGVAPSSAGAFYVGRRGDSTGSTADDWVGVVLDNKLAFAYATDPSFVGWTLADMIHGGPNPIPEPGSLALLGLGGLAFLLRRKA